MGWEDIAIKGGEYLLNQLNSQIQYGQTKRLMSIQQQNQMELNRQGQELQLDTWAKTNYPAQMAMLKQAGLNPGLMYSKGGAGGTTGGQTGGSASMGQAPQRTPMDLSNIVQMERTRKEADLIEAQKNKTIAEQKEIEARTPTYQTAIGKIIAETANEQLKGELIKVQTTIEQIRSANTQWQIDSQLANLAEQTNKLRLENKLTAETFDSVVKEARERAVGQHLENELTQAKTTLTNTEKQKITTEIVQKWTELGLEGRKLDQKDTEILIEKFKAEITAEYPGVMNIAGSLLKKAYKSLEYMATFGGQWKGIDNTDKIPNN